MAEREAHLRGLSRLVRASWDLLNAMGWDHERSYVRRADENAFEAAVKAADEALEACSRHPAQASPPLDPA